MKQGYFETAIGTLYVRYELKSQVVVFLSGAGTFSTYENFQEVIHQLPENMGFVAVDLPNSGRSELSNQVGVGIEDVVGVLLEIFNSLNISRYLLVAHSLSGVLALKLCQMSAGCMGLVTIEPLTYDSLFGHISENPYPEWLALEEKIEAAGGASLYLQKMIEAYLPLSISSSLIGVSQQISQELAEQTQDFQQSWEMTPCLFDDLQLVAQLPHVLFCQEYREEEYRASEYWNETTELVLGGSQHYLQWSQSREIATAVTKLAGQD